MRNAIVFEARREGYGIDQIRRPVTVGELKRLLDDFDDDDLFILSHDNGYTYGSIDTMTEQEWNETEDGEWIRAEYE